MDNPSPPLGAHKQEQAQISAEWHSLNELKRKIEGLINLARSKDNEKEKSELMQEARKLSSDYNVRRQRNLERQGKPSKISFILSSDSYSLKKNQKCHIVQR